METETYENEKELVERDCKAKWDREPALRAEFAGDFDAYCAFVIAKGKGLIRIQGEQAGR
jgi:hypothetical protein